MGLLDRDSRGYALSLDLLLALIPLTLVLGMVAVDMDNALYQVEDALFRGSTERAAADTLNALLETSGDPYDWEKNSTVNVVGLAVYNDYQKGPVKNVLSPEKVFKITSVQIEDILGSEYGYSLNISSISSGTNVLSRGTLPGSAIDSNAKDIVRLERIVLYSKFDIVAQAINIRGTGTPIVITGNKFPTNIEYNNLFDYYVYVNSTGVTPIDSAWVDVNGLTVVSPDDFRSHTNPVVKFIDPGEYGTGVLKNETDLLDNDVTIRLAGKPGDKMNVYILQVPKGTPSSEINLDGGNMQRFRVQFYVWLR